MRVFYIKRAFIFKSIQRNSIRTLYYDVEIVSIRNFKNVRLALNNK